MTDTQTDAATRLAQEIHARRTGQAAEEANLKDHPTYVRAKKYREQDAARINGMVIALTFILGVPHHMASAEDFITACTS